MSSLQNASNLTALNGTGVESKPAPTGLVTLGVDDYYFAIPVEDEAVVQSIHIQTGALIAGTFTVQGCNFGKDAPGGVTDYDETAGGIWVPIDIAAAGYAQGVGTGWTITVLSLLKAAGAGSAIINLFAHGFRRLRLKAAITTGGTVRVGPHGKH